MTNTVKLIECPRDAWQGLPEIIPTETKVTYLRELVAAGFQHIDAVSFVSPKHVKQMADSEEVMARLLDSLPDGATLPEIIGIVVNEKGLERALATPGVSTIGYPYSISAYFRRANANMTRAESRTLVETLKRETKKANKDLVIYISMAFGSPFAGDDLDGNIPTESVLAALAKLGVTHNFTSTQIAKVLALTNDIRAKYMHAE